MMRTGLHLSVLLVLTLFSLQQETVLRNCVCDMSTMTNVVAPMRLCPSVAYAMWLQSGTEAGVHERVQRDVEGLIPFPRVGRRDTSLIDAREAASEKREGLIPFPRVGRSGNSEPRMRRTWEPRRWLITQERAENSKPSGSASATPPWFGPRLGRSQSRSEAASYPLWNLIPIGLHRGQRGRESSFTPRLGRELDLGVALNDSDDEELRPIGL